MAFSSVVVFLGLSYFISGESDKRKAAEIAANTADPEPTSFEATDLREDALREEQIKARIEAETERDALAQRLASLELLQQASTVQIEQQRQDLVRNKLKLDQNNAPFQGAATTGMIPPPQPSSSPFAIPPSVQPDPIAGREPFNEHPPKLVGSIGHVSGDNSDDKKAVDKPKRSQKKTVYLPPSFMEAMLLSGLDAPTNENAKDDPKPILLRVQAPAVLPNEIKTNLAGCFVLAHGFGSLASERVEARVVSLSCLSTDGAAVIDQKVKGFLVDSDGKEGLKGVVVSKAGSHVARTFIAGVFGGLGKAAKSEGTTLSVTGSGTVQTIDPSQILQSGIGGGLADASEDIRKFFLEYARQSGPVIEVGATKKATVIITEGVKLEIKNYEQI